MGGKGAEEHHCARRGSGPQGSPKEIGRNMRYANRSFREQPRLKHYSILAVTLVHMYQQRRREEQHLLVQKTRARATRLPLE